MQPHQNQLQFESSPYLLQHAENPVNWHPWGAGALELARTENKLLLISIGYSACHWCHVMAHESFEDPEVAEIMNAHFINVKVDREERPDIDQVYMSAVQLMSGQGGWPLNVIALPDGKPIYGGTYFPKKRWIQALLQVADLYQTEPQRVRDYGRELSQGVGQTANLVAGFDAQPLANDLPKKMIANWKQRFDAQNGGPNKAPKFPMPTNYVFLQAYQQFFGDPDVTQHLTLTLNAMAQRGLYDQTSGGFYRYSVDGIWKIPHFEKMLYDNAQLIGLYAQAYAENPNPEWARVVRETVQFVFDELAAPDFGFYAALDADSDGVEGAYYTYTAPELEGLIAPEEWKLFQDYFGIDARGYWEEGRFVLWRSGTDTEFCLMHHLAMEDLEQYRNKWLVQLKAHRKTKNRPNLDDKCLTSWNALLVKNLAIAAVVLKEPTWLKRAQNELQSWLAHMLDADGNLLHTKKGKEKKVLGFLDDYALLADACLTLYQTTFNETFLTQAQTLTNSILENFADKRTPFFYYTHRNGEVLFAQQIETEDNVIPSSNSVAAKNLFVLGRLLGQPEWEQRALEMAMKLTENITKYPEAYANWGFLALWNAHPFGEIAVCGGSNPAERGQELFVKLGLMAAIAAAENSTLGIFEGRLPVENTTIYVCKNHSCARPVGSVMDVAAQFTAADALPLQRQ